METYMDTVMLGVNNGPVAYRQDLGQGNLLVGGISPVGDGMADYADTSKMASLYRSMNVPGVRPNDLGGPFDLRCMFPIQDPSDIPSENSTYEEIRDDPRWNWNDSDAVFAGLLENGLAPYLKLASREWVSGLQQGWSYVDEGGSPVYVVQPQNLPNFCSNWPYISPIMESIGDKLVLAVVERYNNATMWSESMAKFRDGAVSGAPLERDTWAGVTNATVGVELQNEYNMLTCLKTGSGDTTSLEGWRENCGGPPYSYGGKYWDGTPEGAYKSFVSQAAAIKRRFPGVMVGGPAIGTGSSFGFAKDFDQFKAGGVALDWIRNFLGTVRESTRDTGIQLMDWFSWHAYTSCVTGGCNNATSVDCSADNPTSMMGIARRMRALLDSEGFADTPMVISEHNVPFAVNGGNTYPGNAMGAAMAAANIVGMALSKDDIRIAGAYIVNGVDGPFVPYNANSFPLSCTPEWQAGTSNTVIEPADITFSGWYVNNCTHGENLTGAMTINAANGMGILYSNGDKKPTALVYKDILSQFISKRIKPLASDLPTSVVGMYTADDFDGTGCRRALLVNADPFNPTPMLPTLSALLSIRGPIDDSSVRVHYITQHIRGMPDIVLPNNICAAGTVQVVGQTVEAGLEETGYLQANGSLQLPPAGVAVFSGICIDDTGGQGAASGLGVSSTAFSLGVLVLLLVQ